MARRLTEEEKYEREQQKIYKQRVKQRKAQAKARGYVFENKLREISPGMYTRELGKDFDRTNAILKDYIFYQFFALDDELDDLTDEQLDEIIYDKKNTVVEWRADNIPVMELRPTNEEPLYENRSNKNIIGWIVVVAIWIFLYFFLYNIIFDTPQENKKPVKQTSQHANVEHKPVQSEPVYEENTYYNSSSYSHNDYKNVELSEEDLRRVNKANERYERSLEKHNKKMERKAEKQEQKLAKRALKEEKKELKKQHKEAKKNKKKDKE